MHKFTLVAIFFGLTMLNCSNINPPAPKFLRSKESRSLQLDRIKLPAGFKIEVFEDKIGFQANMSILDLLFNVGPQISQKLIGD